MTSRPRTIGRWPRFHDEYPKVRRIPELMVTEERGLLLWRRRARATLDLSLYLVEKFCGHDVAIEGANAALIETPRAWQAGFAVVPMKTEHNDEAISVAQDWLLDDFHRPFPLDARSSHRDEPKQFRAPFQIGDW